MPIDILGFLGGIAELASPGGGGGGSSSSSRRLPSKARGLLRCVEVIISQSPAPPGQALPVGDFPGAVREAAQQAFAAIKRIDLRMHPDAMGLATGCSPALAASTADAVLLFAVSCVPIRPDCVNVEGWLQLVPKTDALKQFRPEPDDANPFAVGNAIYRSQFVLEQSFPSAAPGKTVERFAAGQVVGWAADEVKKFK
jgi:hypothetical protein